MRYRTAVITAATLAFSGCGSVTEPSTPLPVPTPPAIPATPSAPPIVTTGSAAWTLELLSFKVRLFRREPGAPLQYEPETLVLKEIGGRSSAILRYIYVDLPGRVHLPGGNNNGGDCTDAQMVAGEIIGAGATRDLAVTMGYCMPYLVTNAEVTEVWFTATFADDGGKVGQVRGSANVTGCTLGGNPGLVSCK